MELPKGHERVVDASGLQNVRVDAIVPGAHDAPPFLIGIAVRMGAG